MADTKNDKNSNSPTLRFPGFTEPWIEQPLSEIVERVTRKNSGLQSTRPLTISAMYGLVDQQSFFNKIVAGENLAGYYLIKNGEFAYNKSSSADYPWGAIKRLDNHSEGVLSTLYICFSPKSSVCSNYLAQYFESNKWHSGISEIAQEGARNHGLLNVGVKDFFATKHHIPSSISEQEQIAKFLQLLDERIATQRRLIDKLETLIKGIVVYHFNSCNTKRTIAIKDLGEAYSVGNLSKDDLSKCGEQCIIYGELFTTYGCVAREIQSRTNKYNQATLGRAGDLLFPASTTVDAISLTAPTSLQVDGVYVAGDMFGIHISPQFNSEYISYLLNYVYYKNLSKYAQGSTIIHLHYADIKNTTIQVPCLEEQNKCAELLERLQSQLDVAKQLIDCYQLQKSYLLRQMFK